MAGPRPYSCTCVHVTMNQCMPNHVYDFLRTATLGISRPSRKNTGQLAVLLSRRCGKNSYVHSPPPSLGNPGNNMQIAGRFGGTTSRRYETMWRRTLVGRECRTMPGKATAGYSTTSCEGQPDPRPHATNTLAIFEAVTHLVPRRHLPTPPGQGTESCLGEPAARAQQALMPACTNVL